MGTKEEIAVTTLIDDAYRQHITLESYTKCSPKKVLMHPAVYTAYCKHKANEANIFFIPANPDIFIELNLQIIVSDKISPDKMEVILTFDDFI